MKNKSFQIIVCICIVMIAINFMLISNQISTLNDNTKLLINRTDTILTILQD